MTLNQLNEGLFSKKPYKMENGFAMFDIDGTDKVYVTKLKPSDRAGEGYRVFFKGKGQTFKDNQETLIDAIASLNRAIKKIIDGAKDGVGPDRAPADIKFNTITPKVVNQLSKDLK